MTARAYLDQISISLSPSSVAVADQALRGFCEFLAQTHPGRHVLRGGGDDGEKLLRRRGCPDVFRTAAIRPKFRP